MDDQGIRSLRKMAFRGKDAEELIKLADQLGNVQVARTSFAYTADTDKDKGKIWIRVTGRADQKRMVAFLRGLVKDTEMLEEKGPKAEPITLLHAKNQPPAFALVGNTDVLMASYEGNEGDHLAVVRDALDVFRGRKASVARGKVAEFLKDVSPDASALVAGELSDQQRLQLARTVPATLPRALTLQMIRNQDLTLRMRCQMGGADDAKDNVDRLIKMKKDANELLDRLPPPVQVPKEVVEQTRKAIAAAKVYSEDKTVFGEITFPGSVFKPVPDLLKKLIEGKK
jgi:hypothetical protein